MTAKLETGEFAKIAREPHIFIGQGLAVRRAWPWRAEALEVRTGRNVEKANPVLEVHFEKEQHTAELAHKRHELDATEFCYPLHEFAEGRSMSTLFASNAGLLHRYRGARVSNMR